MSLTSRACVATYGLAALFTGLSARLHHLAVDKHEHFKDLARLAYEKKIDIPARRGRILAEDGSELARNEPLKDIIADDTLLFELDPKTDRVKRDHRRIAAELIATALKDVPDSKLKTPEDVLDLIKPGRRWSIIQKKITEDVASVLEAQLEAHKIKGIIFEQNFERIYPSGELACHVLGSYGWESVKPDEKPAPTDAKPEQRPAGPSDGPDSSPAAAKKEPVVSIQKGLEGIERSMETWLAGKPGWRWIEKDGRGQEIASYRGMERAPQHGADVRLTIDLGVQQIVESELADACKKLKPKRATIIVMDPHTGDILALANRPSYDPNKLPKTPDELAAHFNFAIAGSYEPGSVFKIVPASGALNRGLANLREKIHCRNGTYAYPGGKISDHHPYGDLTVEEIIAKSSNIGAVILAKRMGERPFYEFTRSYGFGSRTGILLPGEFAGTLHPLEKWGPGSIYHVPFGHEIAATPLQLITAMSVIANDGKLMMPHIVRDIRDADGTLRVDYPPQDVRTVIRPETAAQMRGALEKVTSKIGTAIRARVPGFRVAGKTGTSMLFNKATGNYSSEDHTVSFVGFLPAEKPRFSCLVVIEDSAVVNGRTDTGGLVAAPVFSKVSERVARHLGLEPDPVLLEEELQFRKVLLKEGRL